MTPEQMKARLIEKFESILQQQGLDAVDREAMMSRLLEALDNPATLEPVDAERLQADVTDTIGMLRRNGLIDPAGGESAQAAFASTFTLLQNESVRKAMEFARISREEGEAKARQWLATQATAEATGQSPTIPDVMPANLAAAMSANAFRR